MTSRTAAQSRQWRADNPEKQQAINRRAREKRLADPALQEADRAYQREWMRAARTADPEKYRDYRRQYDSNETNKKRKLEMQKHSRHLRQYGITLAEREELFKAQGSCCAICKSTSPGGRHGWHMDHDHVTNKLRSLLCNHCNLMLGHCRDSIDTLLAAVEYLKCHR